MIEPQRLSPDRQGAKVEGLGLGEGTLVPVKPREVVEAGGDIGVPRPKHPLLPRQLLHLQRDGFCIPPLLTERLYLLQPLQHLGRHLRAPPWAGLGE